MFSEFKKSINNILNERISSPLFGAFLFSWIVWNWKIIYLTLFIADSKIVGNKIEYILLNYSNNNHQIWYPIYSTFFLLLIYPFISTGAFWVSIKFSKWRSNIKNSEEKKQLLSIEQSLELREEIRNQEEKFDRLLKTKTEEIALLKIENENYREQLKSLNQNVSELPIETKADFFVKEYESLKSNKDLFAEFKKIAPRAQRESPMFTDTSGINRTLFDYFLANDYITKGGVNIYNLTEKGKYFNKLLLDEKFNQKK